MVMACMAPAEVDSFVLCIVNVFARTGAILPLINRLLRDEFAINAQAKGTLMRSNSIVSKITGGYVRILLTHLALSLTPHCFLSSLPLSDSLAHTYTHSFSLNDLPNSLYTNVPSQTPSTHSTFHTLSTHSHTKHTHLHTRLAH